MAGMFASNRRGDCSDPHCSLPRTPSPPLRRFRAPSRIA